jgi:hypothetical protein
VHEGVEALIGICMPFVGEMEVEHGRCEVGMAQGTLEEPGMHAGFKPRGGGGMPQGMDGDAHVGDAGPVFGDTEGALDARATPRRGRRRTVGMIPPRGGNKPGGVTMDFPVRAEPREGLGGQGDVPVLGALPPMDMDLETRAIEVGDLQGEGFLEPESQAIDRGEVDLVVARGGGRQEAPDLLKTPHSGETLCIGRAPEWEGVPVALEDVLREAADATGAETHGGGGKPIDVFAVQEGVLQCLFTR